MISDLIGRHVDWEKLESKANPSMYDKKGFGCLQYLELDRRMEISGDNGLYTSRVKGIESVENGIKVTTLNSVYLIKPWK